MRGVFVKGLLPSLALVALTACASGRVAPVQIMEQSGDQLTLAYMDGVSSQDEVDGVAADYCAEYGSGPVAVGTASGRAGLSESVVWDTVTYRCVVE